LLLDALLWGTCSSLHTFHCLRLCTHLNNHIPPFSFPHSSLTFLQVVGEASLAMQAANIPHNVLIADCGSRVFIWPQAYAERQARGLVPEHLLDIGVNPAVWEISGHMVLKRAQVGVWGWSVQGVWGFGDVWVGVVWVL
jgi:hypothetical protein